MNRTATSRARLTAVIALCSTSLVPSSPASAQTAAADSRADGPIAPSEYLGYPVGADFRLAPWDSITDYLNRLADASPMVRVDTLGRTTLGRPFVLVTASAPGNMERLEEIRANQAKLADPRRLAEGELDRLLDTQPAVVFIGHNIHSTEIASSQGAMELAYALATDPELTGALQDVVVLLVPSLNPDGQVMVVDWYRRTAGTPYEGSRMPWLYHHYVGHDNNRDWFMLTQVETRMVTDLLYRRWFPEVVYDVHQMGNDGARFFIPPFDDPVNPNLDPLLVRMISLFGLQVSVDLEAAGRAGVVNRETYDLWWHGGARTVPARHNMVGILSEAASARLASPIFQERRDLDDAPEFGVNYPNPWPGGWWRIRDILDYQMIAARSIVGLAALRRAWLIRNYVELGARAIEAGRRGPPFAYVVPEGQRDPGSAARMMEILRLGGVEVHRARAAFSAQDVEYPAGSWVVRMDQPYRAHAKDLLERQDYPDRRLYEDGPPDPPYDVSGWTLPLQMGVEAHRIDRAFEADLVLEADSIRPAPGQVRGSGFAYLLEGVTNAASLALHRTLAAGGTAAFLSEPLEAGGRRWPVGSLLLRGDGVRGVLETLAVREGLSAVALDAASPGSTATGSFIDSLRVGLYQPWTASMDEGWTRWIFDTWELPYATVHDADLRAGRLRERYDVIVLPDVRPSSIIDGREPGTVPLEYAGGIGREGIEAIRSFVRSGGTLICLDSSSDFAIEELELPVENVRPPFDEQRAGNAFYAPGSILRVSLETRHPVAYGMPAETAVYYANSPIFSVHERADRISVIARYPAAGQPLSGYALHEEFLADKAALIEAGVGEGRAILFGFRPQHRGQPHETFKLLFNAIYRGSAAEPGPVELVR